MLEVSPKKKTCENEKKRLNAFKKKFPKLVTKSIAKVTTDDLVHWRDTRPKVVKPATVRRDGNILSGLFTIARREWKWVRESTMVDLKMPPPPPDRDRRISEDEIRRLRAAADWKDNKPDNYTQQIIVAFIFAIETAMRAGEIRGLTWDRVFLKDRYVTQNETKNGTKRHVSLSHRAAELLEFQHGINAKTVFDVKQDSFDTLWRKLRDRCEIEDLHFHDSRHEAITRLARKLEVLDLARMIGHKDLCSLMIYYNATASEIANRLD